MAIALTASASAQSIRIESKSPPVRLQNGPKWDGVASTSSPEALRRACADLIKQAHFFEAVKECRRGFESVRGRTVRDTTRASLAFMLAHAYLLSGDEARARRHYANTVALVGKRDQFEKNGLHDFDRFIQNGWRVETVTRIRAWYAERANRWYEATAKMDEAGRLHRERDEAAAIAAADDAVRIAVAAVGPEDPGVALLSSHAGRIASDFGRAAKAREHYRRALLVNERALGRAHIDVALSLSHLAGLDLNEGRVGASEIGFRRALTIVDDSGQARTSWGRSLQMTLLNNLGELLRGQARFAEALPATIRALDLSRVAHGPESPLTAIAMSNLSQLYEKLGRLDDAQALLTQALRIEDRHLADHPKRALDHALLAAVLSQKGDVKSASNELAVAIQASHAFRAVDHPLVADVLDSIAAVLCELGRLSECRLEIERSLEIRRKVQGPQHLDLLKTLSIRNALWQLTGRIEDARRGAEELVTLTRSGYGEAHPAYAETLIALARFEGPGSAERTYRRALSIFESAYGSVNPATAQMMTTLADFLNGQQRHAEARPMISTAISALERARADMDSALVQALLVRGDSHVGMNQRESAEEDYLRASRFAAVAGLPFLSASVHRRLMTFYAPTSPVPNDPSRALSLSIYHGKVAVNILQSLRIRLRNATEQRGFLEQVRDIYTELARRLVEAGRIGEAQRVLDLLKDQEYVEYTRRDAGGPSAGQGLAFGPLEDQWSRRMERARDTLSVAETRWRGLGPSSSPSDRRQAQADREAAAVAFDEAIRALREAFSTYESRILADARLRADSSTPGHRIERSGLALLHTATLPDGVLLILSSRGGLRTRFVPIDRKVLYQRILDLRLALREPAKDPRPIARSLYDVLVDPMIEEIRAADVEVLLTSLDGPLRYVPFGVLFDGRKYLAQRFATASYTGAARFAEPSGAWSVATVTAFGATRAQAGYPALPGVAREVHAIVKAPGNPDGAVPGRIYLDAAFTRRAFARALGNQKGAIHVASHFRFDPFSEAESRLLLGDGSTWSLAEFRRSPLSLRSADLLTLSACDSGAGAGMGDEIDGLGRTAQAKGARQVLATLWPVADASTAEFMRRFYGVGKSGIMATARALRQAQVDMIEGRIRTAASPPVGLVASSRRGATAAGSRAAQTFEADSRAPFAHPFYWAPFVLMGAWL
ncbi:MAG: CHAT domain-containing protein [Burkholderiaceae bacterium]|nr:CHAT domain-containing protein [Burkholderiaceae bacterium]